MARPQNPNEQGFLNLLNDTEIPPRGNNLNNSGNASVSTVTPGLTIIFNQ